MIDDKGKKVALSVLKNLMDEMDGMEGMRVMMVAKKKKPEMEMEDDDDEEGMKMHRPMMMGKSLRAMLKGE